MNDLFSSFTISPIQKRLFIGTLVAIFVLSSLQYLGIKAPQLLSPIAVEHEDVFEEIKAKLHQKSNIYHLNKQNSLVKKAQAVADYDSVNAYIVVDFQTGNVLAEKNLSKRVPIASLTKIMTTVVALDLASLDDTFTVSRRAAEEIPTKIGVVPGQHFTLRELLQALMLTSANDAAAVTREGIDEKYGEEVFIKAMNEKAAFLQLRNSNFSNPQGFDAVTHYSSAEDLAILTHYAMNAYPFFKEIVKKDYVRLSENQSHKQYDLYNWNGLIGVYPNTMGVKIGNTEAASKTTVVLSERDGRSILVVLLGAPGILERDMWAAELLDVGFNEFSIASAAITEEQLRQKYNTWQYWD